MLRRLSKLDRSRSGESHPDDRGETLVELLVALVVMATAVVAILGAMATAIRISELHRRQAEAGALMREFAERIESKVAEADSKYSPCAAGAGDQALVGHYQALWDMPVEHQTRYQRQVVKVNYWNNASSKFESTCPGTGDYGVQRVSLRLWSLSSGADVTETLDVTIRIPCRVGDDPCA